MSKTECVFKSVPFLRKVTASRSNSSVACQPVDPIEQLFPEHANRASPVYAIPGELLTHLLEVMPDWMTGEEEAAERHFAESCRTNCCIGVVDDRGIQHPCLDVPESPQISAEVFEELNWGPYIITHAKADDQIRQALEWAERVRAQMTAYTGWLITNSQFIAERDQLRQKWGPVTDALGHIPEYPVRVNSAPAKKRTPRGSVNVTHEFVGDLRAFYDRWILLGFPTWDLPKPRGGNVGGPPEFSKLAGVAAEPMVQVSPAIRLSQRYPIHAILKSVAGAKAPDHLAEWIDVQKQQQTENLRYHRFSQIFRLRFYRDVVLASRYSQRFQGNTGPLDEVFGRFLGGLGEDAVKKLRIHVNARLSCRK